MRITFYFLILMTGSLFTSCSENGIDKKKESIKEDLKENKQFYSKLISDIKSFNFNGRFGKLINNDDLPDHIKADISNLKYGGEVRYLIINRNSKYLYYSIEIVLDGNWYVNYSDVPNNLLKPGSYQKEEFIETWGVDKNWSITHDSDYI